MVSRFSAEVAVVLPVRNGGIFLDAAIGSIRDQTFSDLEIIVVDDGSTDNTAEIVAVHAAQDERVTLLKTSGQGIVDTLNTGLAHTIAPLVARMDADDVAEASRIDLQRKAMMRKQDLVVLGSSAWTIDSDGKLGAPIDMQIDPDRIRHQLRTQNPILHPTAMIRNAALRKVGGYRGGFPYAEDYDLWLRLSREGPIGSLPDRLMRLRRHRNQTSRLHRLDQRAGAALARLRFFSPLAVGPETGVAATNDPFTSYLTARVNSGVAFGESDWKEIALILRACQGRRMLGKKLRREIIAMLSGQLSVASLLALRVKLLARQ